MLKKSRLIEEILSKLTQEFEALHEAALAAHEAATHEESLAEDKHDTRGLEASYLAGAQANRAAELKQLIGLFRLFEPREFTPQDAIAPGAVVELEVNGRKSLYFLMIAGGGVSVPFEGRSVHVITTQSPLGDELLGKRVGDLVEVETQKTVREYEVTGIY
jgi:transcription elongation GreA/GreB family factor